MILNNCTILPSLIIRKTPCRTAITGLFCVILLTACGKDEAGMQTPELAVKATVPPAQTTDLIETASESMTEPAYRRHIEILASDEFGGRAPASPGEELTVDYLVEHFKGLGLQPANGDSYTQEVPLAWVEVINKPELHVSGGSGDDLTLEYATEHVLLPGQQTTGIDFDFS